MAMKMAIINKATGMVENTAVPPEGAQVYFVGEGYDAVLTDDDQVQVGSRYDKGQFINPDPNVEEEA